MLNIFITKPCYIITKGHKMPNTATTIKFYLGEESRLVIDDFSTKDKSIFKDSYNTALSIVSDYIKNSKKQKNNSTIDFFRQTADVIENNIIAFLGDRGTGKSSCMLSVANMLKDISSATDKTSSEIKDNSKTGFEILETIDPSFFEEGTNILEIVLGRMFSNFKKKCKIGNTSNYSDYEDVKKALFKAFEAVKESIVQKNRCRIEEEDCADSLLKLTASVDLRASFKNLIDKYLAFVQKDYFVIPVDDLDLNTEYAYEMTEQIRKYLRQEKVVILMALKFDQLKRAIQLEFERQYRDLEDKRLLDFQDMVAKYIGKLIPEKNRVFLPTVDAWLDSSIEIYKKNDIDDSWIEYDENHKNQTLKYYVISLIFQKTRYLFYHSEDNICPIIPTNLRELRQLISTLCAMPDYTNDFKCENNKTIFKEYFLNVWVPNQLNFECSNYVQKLFKISNPSDINKSVIKLLKEYVVNVLPSEWNIKDDGSNAELEIVQILDNGNVSFNITLGDVLLVLSYLKDRLKDHNNQMMIFAIKTFYSMRLYEYYDLMTEKKVVKKKEELNKNVDYTIKKRDKLDELNAYDILVGGAFVNTEANSVLSPTKNGIKRDIRVITKESLDSILDSIESEGDTEDEKLKWVEFFILFTSRINYDAKRAGVSEKRWRCQEEVYYTAPLNSPRLKFDVFSIFSNIINIERQYKRFSEKLYDRASKENADSLYNRLKKYCYDNRGHRSNPPDKKWDERWNLLSWGAIRNIDVLESLTEYVYSLKKGYSGENFEHISTFLRNISEFKIKTYDILTNDDRYTITFEFLKNIREFIETEKKNGHKFFFDKVYSSHHKDNDYYEYATNQESFESNNNQLQVAEATVSYKTNAIDYPKMKHKINNNDAAIMLKKNTDEGIRRFLQLINPTIKGNKSFNTFWKNYGKKFPIPTTINDAKRVYKDIVRTYNKKIK